MTCRIEKLICESVVSTDEDVTVQEATELMAGEDVSALVVTHDQQVVGLFTEHDLLRKVVALGKDPAHRTLGEVCTRDLITVPYDSTCQEAIRKMRAHRCRRLLVYDDDDFLGLVKLPDVAHALAEGGSVNNFLLNAIATVTLSLAVGVIAIMVYKLPEMMQLADNLQGW